MKIFNWVQRRFHHNVLKDGLARNVKKTDSIAIDTNTKALLEQVALVDVLDGWRDGILTIGTFGFDPLKSFGEQKDYLALESDDDEEEGEAGEERYSVNNDDEEEDDDDDYDNNNNNNIDEEVNPLMFSTFDHSFENDVESNVNHAKYGKPDMIMMFDGVAGSTDHEIKFDLDATEGHSGKLRRRTTLADLFSEDSEMKKKPSPLDLKSNYCKKASVRTKNGLSFAKKLIPQVGEDSRPIKMLHQMMRRMLKRKIHPELEGKGNKLDGQCKPNVINVLGSKKHEAGESVSLLQSPGHG
ncbi:uncharacterized protein LOC111305979 isoform X2 [Durio zibethinus]|uniref:Protein TILLER ANGLE CONTROL 1 n=1 Tax=Durio zibethinus TaxID=66656 RepID=A0A6P6A4F7_DURZI|nr:uncharacterized protein LOC111305979 isoform X2 [Durio zibethinus]